MCLEHYQSENKRQCDVILQLGKDKAELERLLEKKKDLIESCEQHILADNKRLEKENEKLRRDNRNILHNAKMNAIAIQGIAQSFQECCEEQEKGETE